ncbi:LCP family protein [Planococcus sp. N028]|uniref:Regulatory protein MsrR n=1 Tax=Planococcus shixiaomingii TaxID=3058393 RepID=A0ABT8MYC6_9BACL|nr:LCP family protein [Planococcus sp. N028]MDN7240603.1 LCP family protein [Planococcus sp. N028]
MAINEKNEVERKISKKRVLIFFLPFLLISSVFVFLAYNSQDGELMLEQDQRHYKEEESKTLHAETVYPEVDEINVLLIGSDRRGDEFGLSDALMVANYNPDNNQIKLVSFMRDTYVEIPDHGMQKINAAHAFGGPQLVSETIQENFGIKTDYYASVDFNGFPKLLDLMVPKGIEVEIPYEMSHGIGMTLEPGIQTLNGDQLLGYVRFRHDKKSDFGRVERQQEILTALKYQGMNVHSLMNLPKIIEALDTYVDTDLDKRTLLSFGKFFVQSESGEIDTFRVPAADTFTEERKNVGEVLVPDLVANQEKLDDFLSFHP